MLSYIFRNDVQILLVQVGLSGWFAVSVVPFSYVVGVGCDRLCGLVVRVSGYRYRSPALPDFLSSSGSGTGSTQPREVKLRGYLNKKVAAPGSENRD